MRDKKEVQRKIKEWIWNEIERKGVKKLSRIFEEAREKYRKEMEGLVRDVEQSWKPFKGNLLEDIIRFALKNELEKFGLKIISGKDLERGNLSPELSLVKRNLVVNFGEFGMHLPDADLVVYNPNDGKVMCIISSKTTLRERIAQTGYWKLKLLQDALTKDIKVFFITLDEDGDLLYKFPTTKGRAICEVDTDGTYVITLNKIEESRKVKVFERFFDDIVNLIR